MNTSDIHILSRYKKIPFLFILILMLVMGGATIFEKYNGSTLAYEKIYGSWWFCSLWGIMAIGSLISIVTGKLYKNPSLFTLHISFIVILAGALCTKLLSTRGYVILKQHEVCNSMYTEAGTQLDLPFSMELDRFYINYYPGTNSPADYISIVTIYNPREQENVQEKISMNHILSYQTFRFYQSSFEPDMKTSILTVNSDPYGIGITYSGYILFVLSMLWFLLAKQNRFRQLISHPILKKTWILLICLIPFAAQAQILTKDSLTLSKNEAEAFGKLWMLYEGRIAPVSTFARDFTITLCGKSSIGKLSSEQILSGFLFFPEKWKYAYIFQIKDRQLQQQLNAIKGKASYSDFFDENGYYKLKPKLQNSNKKTAQEKEIEKLNDNIQLIHMLHSGKLLQLFPYTDIAGHITWFSPVENKFSDLVSNEDIRFMQQVLSRYYQAIHLQDEKECRHIRQSISDFQEKQAKTILPSPWKKQAELFYLHHDFTSILYKINLSFGLLSLILFFAIPHHKQKSIFRFFLFILMAAFLCHSITIGLRTYIAGRFPLSNGFETMLFIAWFSMLLSIMFVRKVPFIIVFGFLLSGCSLLVAHLGMMNPKITPLVPVLSSPLLSIHVSAIMIAYTLLAFAALNSLLSLLFVVTSSKKSKQHIIRQLEKNKIYNLLCLYPSLFFMGTGIFIGAVWANISWGRYWGWDPKEVWALITFLAYCLILHEKQVRFLKNPFLFHVYTFLAFATVLMTYFGVNYFLGGMHSYAGEATNLHTNWIMISTILIVLLITAGNYRLKNKKK